MKLIITAVIAAILGYGIYMSGLLPVANSLNKVNSILAK